ncbi:MAG: gliding motility protein GldC [Ignavibacteriales bacterium]|nr:gliding motility protein GldC [Ignavibacteriales bacterium]
MQYDLTFSITTDENNVPEKLTWHQSGDLQSPTSETKALMVSFWSPKEQATYGIDLWTKEMPVLEMQIMYHQVFLKMADTFERATFNKETAEMLRSFAKSFGESLNLFDKSQE